jgi:hypothetical protein
VVIPAAKAKLATATARGLLARITENSVEGTTPRGQYSKILGSPDARHQDALDSQASAGATGEES